MPGGGPAPGGKDWPIGGGMFGKPGKPRGGGPPWVGGGKGNWPGGGGHGMPGGRLGGGGMLAMLPPGGKGGMGPPRPPGGARWITGSATMRPLSSSSSHGEEKGFFGGFMRSKEVA